MTRGVVATCLAALFLTLSANAQWIQCTNQGTGALNCAASGTNVGIGTQQPTSQLHVAGQTWIANANNAIRLIAGANGGSNLIDSNFATGGAYLPLRLSANAGSFPSQLYLDITGNVGIGTSSPSGQLHVAGSSVETYFASNS